MVWLHGTLHVTIYEGKNIPLDRVLRFHVKAGPTSHSHLLLLGARPFGFA